QSPNTVTVNVAAINHAPAGADKSVTTNEDIDYVFLAADFGFSDPNDTPPNSLFRVKITTLPSSGTLKYNGGTVAVGQEISATDLGAFALKFSPAPGAS